MTKFQIIHYRMQDKKQSFFRRRDYIMGWSLNSLRNYDIVYFKGEKNNAICGNSLYVSEFIVYYLVWFKTSRNKAIQNIIFLIDQPSS